MKVAEIKGMKAAEIMEMMENAGIDGQQDWDTETTTYNLEDGKVIVSGPSVDISSEYAENKKGDN